MKKLIYIRLPKTASTSISDLLIKENNFKYLNSKNINHNNIIIEPLRLIKYNLINTNIFSNGLYNEYNKIIKIKDHHTFTIVRSPYTRLVSAWKYLTNHEKIKSNNMKKNIDINFEDFVYYVYKEQKNLELRDRWHIEPYSNLLNKSGKIFVDTIIKFEKINKEFKDFCEKFNIKGQLKTLNSSKIKNYNSYYNETLIEMVNEIYKSDFNLFKYKMI